MSEFEGFRQRVNLLFVLDHAGRAGNGFFQTIFDQHPQVLACSWMHYVYSYIITEYGEDDQLCARFVWERWRETAYFGLLYNELDDSRSAFIRKMGGDPSAELNRSTLRKTFDKLLLDSTTISRRDLVLAIFFSYAVGRGVDPGGVRYILCPDSISLRSESAMTGFSGKVIDIALSDFPQARLIHLERDPRAGFASSTHQFINQLGNMYGLRAGRFFERLGRLRRQEFDWDSVFVFGFWLIYFRQTYKTIMRKRKEYPNRFLTVYNEDLNLNFVATVNMLATNLDIEALDAWTGNFVPTMLGKPWMGTGAYNSQYQTHCHGPLKNDPDNVARRASGPNAHVTTRWRKRMKRNEIFIVEALLAEEISLFGYDFVYWNTSAKEQMCLHAAVWQPLSGELPTLRWITAGLRVGTRDFLNRLFYLFAFPVFYIQARLTFLSIVKEGRIFELQK